METVRLDVGIDRWLKDYKQRSVKPATYDRLRVSYTMLCRHPISQRTIGELTAEDIQEYVNDLHDGGYALTTVKKQLTLLSAYLKYEFSRGGIVAPVYLGAKLPSADGERREMDVFTPHEQELLLQELSTMAYPAYGAIALMLEMGLRTGEAQCLTWDDVLWSKKAVRIHRTLVRLSSQKGASFVQNSAKSKTSNRTIPASRAAMEILEQLRLNRNASSPYVFPSAENPSMPIAYFSVRYAMQQACKRCGVRYRSVHALRHTFATNCYNRGCDVKILSKLLGHADVAITYNIYIHLYGDALEEMRKVIE